MFGAICGDVLGSTYEFDLGVNENFYLIHKDDHYTDDSLLTCAVAKWVLDYSDIPIGANEHKYVLSKLFRDFVLARKDREIAFGNMFVGWVDEYSKSNVIPACHSYGNGSAMRVSPLAYAFHTLQEVEYYAKLQAEITHDNPEGIRGACAIAGSSWLALHGMDKEEIKRYVEEKYYYDVGKTIEEMRGLPKEMDCSCQNTVPMAIIAFLTGKDYEDVVRNAISIGCDSDTVAAMAGSIAYAYYKEIPKQMLAHCLGKLDEQLYQICISFAKRFHLTIS